LTGPSSIPPKCNTQASNDYGLWEYEQLRLKLNTWNNACLAELGFNNGEEKKVKRRSAPAKPSQSLELDSLRRQNPIRASRAATFKEASYDDERKHPVKIEAGSLL
jgi:hypothetical protein